MSQQLSEISHTPTESCNKLLMLRSITLNHKHKIKIEISLC